MTNARAYPVRHRRWIAAQCIAVGLAVMPLAGCQTADVVGGPVASGSTASDAPATGRAKLAFAPIVGAPAAVAQMLQNSISSAVEHQSIPVSHGGADVPDYTVRGYLVAAPDKTGTKLSYIWDITDKTGQRAKRITGEEIVKGKKTKDPWASVDQSVVDRIAASTTGQLVPWVPMRGGASPNPPGSPTAQQGSTSQSTFGSSIGQIFGFGGGDQTASAAPAPAPAPAAATATPPAQSAAITHPSNSLVTGDTSAPATTSSLTPKDASTIVPAVIGAPGDGSTSLTAALQRALSGNGVKLAAAGSGGSSYTVQGHVAMGQPAAGKQTIKIEWQVFDPAGKKVGTVSQNNVVPQGSLDGPWGKTADAAAAAAAQGVLKLLPHQTATN